MSRTEDFHPFLIDEDIVNEVRVAAELIQEATGQEASVIDAAGQEFMPGPEAADALLYISGSALGWLSKKWIEEYVWPVLRERMDNPSRKVINWLLRIKAERSAAE